MSRFDQQMREVERSLAQLTGNKTQAAQFRRKLATKIQQAAAKKLPKIARSVVESGRTGWVNDPGPKSGTVLVERDPGCVIGIAEALVAGLAQFDEGFTIARGGLLTLRTTADLELHPRGEIRPQIAAQTCLDSVEAPQLQLGGPPDGIGPVLGGKDGTGEGERGQADQPGQRHSNRHRRFRLPAVYCWSEPTYWR